MSSVIPGAEADVVVVGGGSAALCAAISAREQGSRVTLLEKAPFPERGGNSRFTDGAIRVAYRDRSELLDLLRGELRTEFQDAAVDPYPADAFESDLHRLSSGGADGELCRKLATESMDTLRWLCRHGVEFEPLSDQQAFRDGDRLRYWGGLILRTRGKGKGLIEAELARARELGVDMHFGHEVTGVDPDPTGGMRVQVRNGEEDRSLELRSGAVILACGGFEASEQWRARHLGPQWVHARVRGTVHNQGDGLRMALEQGADSAGDWSGCHSVATDTAAPAFGRPGTGDVFKKHSYPLGIVVNREGERFLDEGADFRNYTYARYGARILDQPGAQAFQIFDDRVRSLLRPEYRHPEATRFEASDPGDLARKMGVDPDRFLWTLQSYNRAVQPGDFNPAVLDGKGTRGLQPPKSNWALPIDSPPFTAFPVTCGITFTYGGLRVDSDARVLSSSGEAIPGLFAAGEMVGNLFTENYPGGSGLMSGAVFGRTAGTVAAREARRRGGGG